MNDKNRYHDRFFDILLRGRSVAFFMVDSNLRTMEFNHLCEEISGW